MQSPDLTSDADGWWYDARVPFQSPGFIEALLAQANLSTCRVSVAEVGEFAFSVEGTLATSLIEGGAFVPFDIGKSINNDGWLAELARNLGATELYFPLVYEASVPLIALKLQHGIDTLKRRPSCAFNYPLPEGTLLKRSTARLGSRALRRIERFVEAGGHAEYLNGASAIEAMSAIEMASWKRLAGQDMFSRGQFGIYAALLKQGDVTMRAAIVNGQAIAYRLDCRIGNVLYILKWSFDEIFRRISPGFFLIVQDIDDLYADDELAHVDLWGSPDTLKMAVADHFIDRHDIAWPKNSRVSSLFAERKMHDARNENIAALSKSIRFAY